MDRRTFVRMSASAGLGVVCAPRWARSNEAPAPYGGPYYVMIEAHGAWDTTLLCDPKGGEINGTYGEGEILTAGPIRYAPGIDARIAGGSSFFAKYASDLLVINGVDMSTNGHLPGQRYSWTGRLESADYPIFAALAAASKSRALAMSYLTFGGFDNAGSVVSASRLLSPSDAQIVALPHHINGDAAAPTYHAPTARDAIERAKRRRIELLRGRQTLPRAVAQTGSLYLAQASAPSVSRLRGHLPASMPVDRFPGHTLKQQAAIALAAFKAGVCAGANLVQRNFDTHANHDADHPNLLANLLEGIDYLMERAEELGVRDQLVVVIGSDFARTPKYNAGLGKDHWSVGSFMLMGRGVRGGRVIGATDPEQKALLVDPSTLEVAADQSAAGLVRLRPEHIHRGLRTLAGVDPDLASRYPLGESDLAGLIE